MIPGPLIFLNFPNNNVGILIHSGIMYNPIKINPIKIIELMPIINKIINGISKIFIAIKTLINMIIPKMNRKYPNPLITLPPIKLTLLYDDIFIRSYENKWVYINNG